MKFTFIKQLFIVCTLMLAFSCSNEDETYTDNEANVLEPNDSKTTIASFKVRLKVINKDTGEEINEATFRSLKIRAKK